MSNLSNAEIERLAVLSEECGETMQLVGKILRHGYESYHPADITQTTNRTLLLGELNDIAFARRLLYFGRDIKPGFMSRERQLEKYRWLKFQDPIKKLVCVG